MLDVTLAVTFAFIIFYLLIAICMKHSVWDNTCENETTIIATTSCGGGCKCHTGATGTLQKQIDFGNGQPFVIDPVDLTKTFLNIKDDMYQDAEGKTWKLI